MTELNKRITELAATKPYNGMSWQTIADIINDEFGTLLSWDACRKRAASNPIYVEAVNSVNPVDSDLDANPAAILLDIKDERTQVNALFRRMNREDSLIRMAEDAAKIISKTKPFLYIDNKTATKPVKEAVLLISDWHYGIVVDNYMNVYNPDICKQRVADLTADVIRRIKENKITKLHLLNLGDMIAGIIHMQLRVNSRCDVVTQTMEVSELLAEMIYTLSKYVNIDYYQVLDNHSRIDPNKKEAMQLESLARFTKWHLQTRLKDIPSINICDNEIDEDIASFYVNDEFLVVAVHGDDDKKASIIPRLSLFIKDQIDLICSAHLHHFSMEEDNRTTLISNGSLMGTDEYAFTKRLDSMPSQTFITFKNTNIGTDIDGIFKLNSYSYS